MAAVQQKSVMKFEARQGVECGDDTRKCGQLCLVNLGQHATPGPHQTRSTAAPTPALRCLFGEGGGRGGES